MRSTIDGPFEKILYDLLMESLNKMCGEMLHGKCSFIINYNSGHVMTIHSFFPPVPIFSAQMGSREPKVTLLLMADSLKYVAISLEFQLCVSDSD